MKGEMYNYTIYMYTVAYFCHYLSYKYADLSDLRSLYWFSDLYVDLSDLYVDLSFIHMLENKS